MRPVSFAIAAIAALVSVLPASAQNQPTNAELYRMLKQQQQALSKQQALIDKLRAELGESKATHETTRKDLQRGDRRVRQLAAQVKNQSKLTNEAHAAFAARPEPNSIAIEGSYLYLKPGLSDTYFAIVGTSAGSPDGNQIANDPGYQSAWRVGATYTSGFSGRKLIAAYTQLSSSSEKLVSGSNIWGTKGSADLLANFENYTGAAHSKIDLEYRRVDVLAAEPVKWLGADMNFLYGVEYAYMNVDETDSYTKTTAAGSSASGSKFSGVGPQVGVSWLYRPFAGPIPAMNGLSVDAAASASLLLASTKSYMRDQFNGTNIGSVTTDSTTRMIPALHARVGLAYDYGWDRFNLTMKAGYEFNTYINGLTRTKNSDDVSDGQYQHDYANADLSGLYVKLGLKAPL